MNILIGTEKQIEWANTIRENLFIALNHRLKYRTETRDEYKQRAAEDTELEMDAKSAQKNLTRLSDQIEKLNNVTEARIYIDYFKSFSKLGTNLNSESLIAEQLLTNWTSI